MTEAEDQDGNLLDASDSSSVVLSRSNVQTGLRYLEYRAVLRYDFYYSCAYCTIAEAEAHGIRFAIDHYEPRNARNDLVDDYLNLMYACDPCNELKGDLCPPPSARVVGDRFFRPDQDIRDEHFDLRDWRLEPRTSVGKFTIEVLYLNRKSLRQIRQMRTRLTECARYVQEGIASLSRFPLDRLPSNIKARAQQLIKDAIHRDAELVDSVDSLLRAFAKSAVLGGEETPEEIEEKEKRIQELKGYTTLHPVKWRHRSYKRRKQGKK